MILPSSRLSFLRWIKRAAAQFLKGRFDAMGIRRFVLLTTLATSFVVTQGQTTAGVQKEGAKAASSCVLQSFSGPTRQSKLPQYPGCECGASDIQITPNPVETKVGTATYLEFDGTQICRGQSTRNFKGTVQWEQLNTDALLDSYGVMCHVYNTGGAQRVKFSFSVDCYDNGAKHCTGTCYATGEVDVKVLPTAKDKLKK
jgi:hypothetical protein